MFHSTGRIIHNSEGAAHIEVDSDLARYYRNQIPFESQRQRYAPHITVVRNEHYNVISWNSISEELVSFRYEHSVYWNEEYVWLAVECPEAEILRIKLGLEPISQFTQSPDLKHRFHITIGNLKCQKK